jgi:hypothetical protein
VSWSAKEQSYIGRALEFPTLIGCGDKLEGALEDIRFLVSADLTMKRMAGKDLPLPLGYADACARMFGGGDGEATP